MRPIIVFSNSSGETFEKVFLSLKETERSQVQAFFCNKDCQAQERAEKLLGKKYVYQYPKKSFEENALEQIQNDFKDEGPIVFLCGFMSLLSENFLKNLALPVVNTHPSLLPAFPGIDKKVHKESFEKVHYGGFTVHMVNAGMDEGPILFQLPVDIRKASDWSEARHLVRQKEQELLPLLLAQLMKSSITYQDTFRSSRDLLSLCNESYLTL